MKTRMAAMLFIALGICAGAACAASVPWNETGHLVALHGGGTMGVRISQLEHPGDEFFLFNTGVGGTAVTEANLVHVGADDVAVGPPPLYLPFDGQSGLTSDAEMVLDGAGGAFVIGNAYQASGVILQHVNAAGVPDWGTPYYGLGSNAVVLSSASLSNTQQSVAADGAGGVWAVWTAAGYAIRLQHFLADGSIAPGWNPAGRTLAASGYGCRVLVDGAGGVIVTWLDASSARAQRILADTTVAPGWPESGLVLGSAGLASSFTPSGLLATGDGHFLAVWPSMGEGSDFPLSAQRFGPGGSLDPGWPAGGLRVSRSSYLAFARFLADGAGGLMVVWFDYDTEQLLWSHVRANGSFAPGHSAAGLSPLDAGAAFARTPGAGSPLFAATNSHDDGIIIAWDDVRPTSQPGIRVRWLRGDGTADPTEPDTARLVPRSGSYYTGVKAAVSDRAGGVFLAFADRTNFPATDVWMNHMARTGATLAVPAPAQRGSALSLSAPQPNPARSRIGVRCTLADERPASLALYDVLGRLRRDVALSGVGEHAAALDGLDALAPGVYLLRLSQGSEQRTARVAVIR